MTTINPVYKFLFHLQKIGVTNMCAASPYIQQAFPKMSEDEANGMLMYWMEHYRDLHTQLRMEHVKTSK
jgi:hypothetical protein